MGRYDLQKKTAIQPVADGDLFFDKLNMKLPREQISSGTCSRLENKRLVRGAETRPGTRTPLYANLYPADSFLGSGVYSNPNGSELGLIATTDGVIGIRSGTVPLNIFVEGDGLLGPTVEFTQHFDKVLLHQSDPSNGTYIWDGVDPDVGFILVTEPSVVEPGISVIPNSPWSVNYMGRNWFPLPGNSDVITHSGIVSDSIGASDVNDPTTYDSILHTFRVNTGSADDIVGIYPYLQNNIIVAKGRSIDIMTNIPNDLGDSYINSILLGLSPGGPPPPRISNISTQVGIVSRKGALLVGGRFMFMSESGGIYQIVTDNSGNYMVDPTPISDAIEPLIDRINWTYASGIVAKLRGIYAYWAVPLDNCTFNNCMLVLNVVTGQWQGVDIWSTEPRDIGTGRVSLTDNPMRMDNLLLMKHYGQTDLFAVNNEDGRVHRMYYGTLDYLTVATLDENGQEHDETGAYPIQDVFESRGYSVSGAAIDSNYVKIGLATLEPTLTFEQIVDGGGGDEVSIGNNPVARSRTKYDSVTRKSYKLNNIEGNSETSGRGDYAVQIGDSVICKNGIRLQRMAPWTQEFSLTDGGRFMSFRISNSTGLCEVRSIVFESVRTRTERIAG